MEKEKKIDFKCWRCGYDEYKEKFESNGILGPGGRTERVYCICQGCSMIFEDPEKFSSKN
jgi:hypothetical protein